MTDPIPTEDLLEELQRLAAELEKTPTQKEMNEHGEYAAPTYQYRFGSWNAAIEIVGIEPNRPEDQEIPREDLLSELRRLADDLGQTPSKNQMKENGAYSTKPYRKRFGSWNGAIEAAGLDINQTGEQATDAALLDEIRRLAEVLGAVPSSRDMERHGRFSQTTYQRRFGSWNNAVENAGFEPVPSGWNPGPQPSDLIETLQGLAIELERTPEPEDVETHTDIDPDLYLDRWDSWWIACAMAGVSQAMLDGVFETDTEEKVA